MGAIFNRHPIDVRQYKDRLMSKCSKLESGCWEFTACKDINGYGIIGVGSRKNNTRTTLRTHILSYWIHVGNPSGECVLHKCDNPSCINPDHLFLGTRADNVRDMDSKGRRGSTPGESNRHCKHTLAQIEEMREKFSTGIYTSKELAIEYGFADYRQVNQIMRNKTWKISVSKNVSSEP